MAGPRPESEIAELTLTQAGWLPCSGARDRAQLSRTSCPEGDSFARDLFRTPEIPIWCLNAEGRNKLMLSRKK